MNSTTETAITPSRIKSMIPGGTSIGIGEDFFLSRLTEAPDYQYLKYPFRIDCYVAAYCTEGEIDCTVNLTKYRLTPGTLLIITPGNIVNLTIPDTVNEKLRFTIIGTSSDFLTDARINLSRILIEAVDVLKDPCIHLTLQEETMLRKYIDFTLEIASAQPQYMKECIGGIVTSVFYQFAGFLSASRQKQEQEAPIRTTRQRQIMEQFMKLAITDHAQEHLVGYYADRLCVTPKYLSKIIKEASGRSVPEWLNELLILDAKNMLRHSDMTIKEISSALNFPNQSFFFRFFKNHTGVTPTQYRNE